MEMILIDKRRVSSFSTEMTDVYLLFIDSPIFLKSGSGDVIHFMASAYRTNAI